MGHHLGGGLGGMQRPRQLLGLFSCLIDRHVIENTVQVRIYEAKKVLRFNLNGILFKLVRLDNPDDDDSY